MRKFVSRLSFAIAAAWLAAPAAAFAQSHSDAADFAEALTTDGIPNLEGTWNNATLTRFERPEEFGERATMTAAEVAELEGRTAAITALSLRPTDPNATVADLPVDCSGGRTSCNYNAHWTEPGDRVMLVGGEPRSSIITSPANGRIPYKARARGGFPDEADNPEERSLPERCLVSQNFRFGALVSSTLYNNTYQIVQAPDHVVLLVEMSHDARIIRLNAEHEPIVKWFGDSVGRYEDATLVVETTNFHPAQLANNSPDLKLTERFTRVAPDRLLYQFTVEDPVAYTQTWSGEYEFVTSTGPVYEYACHEGNYGLVNILSGARLGD